MPNRLNMTDWPTVLGDKRASVIVVTGPNPYAPIVVATPPTGGQLIQAAAFGLKAIDWVQSMGSDNGQFDVVCYSANGNPVSTFGGLPCTAIRIQWLIAATGVEAGAVNLAARTVKILAVGPK